jgi:hypothetical protein
MNRSPNERQRYLQVKLSLLIGICAFFSHAGAMNGVIGDNRLGQNVFFYGRSADFTRQSV